MLRFLFFSLLILSLTACGPNIAFEKNYELSDSAWSYSDTLNFDFEIEDTLQIYNLWLEVDHLTNYRFQNIYTQVHTTFPSGERISELLSLELADKTGLWQGDCNSEACTLKIPIQEGAYFDQAGSYQITLEQFMRKDPLNGIQRISFQIEATKESR